MKILFKVAIIIAAIISITASPDTQAWEIFTHSGNKDAYIIRYRGEPLHNLEPVLNREKRALTSINLGRLVQVRDSTIQQDIADYLSEHHPQDYRKLMSSAGNMHNPNVTSIKKYFELAILKTNYIKRINALLYKYGYSVRSVSTEKFFLIKEQGALKFDALTWLIVKKIT